jgi:3-dehydroquinate synthase
MKVVSPKFVSTSSRLHKSLESQLAERRYLILTDETVSDCCLPHLSEFMLKYPPVDILQVDSGEACKQYEVAIEIWKHLLEWKITRFDVIICLGGGSVCDLGGFIASTYMRGMSFIFLPTTLLAMTDAAIGGKNGIDFQGIKNVIGTINQPEAIFIFKTFLDTLPEAQISSGMAEVIKHGVVQGGELWQNLLAESESGLMLSNESLQLSIKTKLSIVKKDLQEKDLRKVLNFGHSVGHALEAYFLSEGLPIEHGAAVAKGMLVESTLAVAMGLLSNVDALSIQSVISRYEHGVRFPYPSWSVLRPFIQNDKKFSHDKMLFALPTAIGKVVPSVLVEESMLELVYSGFI